MANSSPPPSIFDAVPSHANGSRAQHRRCDLQDRPGPVAGPGLIGAGDGLPLRFILIIPTVMAHSRIVHWCAGPVAEPGVDAELAVQAEPAQQPGAQRVGLADVDTCQSADFLSSFLL